VIPDESNKRGSLAWFFRAAGCLLLLAVVLLLPLLFNSAAIVPGIVVTRTPPPPTTTLASVPSPSPPANAWHLVDVFYATDRVQGARDSPNARYGAEYSDDLAFGHCRVSIPPGHKSGNVERPWTILSFEVLPESVDRHVVLTDVRETSREALLTDLMVRLKSPPDPNAVDARDVLVFVHGFNVSFAEAARQTAQMAYDLSFKGVPFMYSWASKGTIDGYESDAERATLTVPHLRDVVTTLAARPNVRYLHIVAHSMGNRALTASLGGMSDADKALVRSKLNQVVLAAPDIDARVFERQIAPAIKGVAQRITLYASSNDAALKASAVVAAHRRAGDSRPSVLVVDGIDSIDASAVNTGLGHFPVANVRTVIDDLAILLREGLPPDRRNLMRHDPAPVWWLFKP
jgi:esterase/lipase superfamily enzyme